MRVLVTGATGFLGAAICRELLARGHAVRALVRAASGLAGLEGLDEMVRDTLRFAIAAGRVTPGSPELRALAAG